MKVLSLFDGISCARVALDRAGIPVEAYYASEIDKYAIQISQKNYPDIKHIGDVKDVIRLFSKEHRYFNINGTIPDFNLLIGGSPCQDLSIAGKRKGLSGERSGLFYEYVRILKEVKPRYFILENVASMSKEAKQTITDELFEIEPVMINASLVSAQNRKRLFWVGKLVGDTIQKVEIPQPEDKGILLKDILEDNVDEKYWIKTERKNTFATNKPQDVNNEKAQPLLVGGTSATIRIGQIGNGSQADRIYSIEGKSTSLNALGGGGGAKTGLYEVKAITASGTFGNRKISKSDKAYCLSANPSSDQQPRVEMNTKIRKLTPIECERLQGLPDGFTSGISNSQRYKCLGNAFNVDVVAHIIKHLNKE